MTDADASRPDRESGPRVRWALLVGALLVLIGLGTLAYQGWPELAYELGLIDTRCPYPSALVPAQDGPPVATAVPPGKRLVIPAIGVDVQVLDGNEDRALDLGVYHHAETAAPGEGDNIAIAGHRVRRAFTLLHRLEPGDPVLLYWGGTEYAYQVSRVFEIGLEETTILDPAPSERLTLYTCTPRFLGNRRTVVIATPTGDQAR